MVKTQTHAEFLRTLADTVEARGLVDPVTPERLRTIADELELGRNARPRDSRGWRVPTSGSKSRLIYDLLVEGKTSGQIALRLKADPVPVRVLVWKIKHPEADNALRRPK